MRRWRFALATGVAAAALQCFVLFRTLMLANRAWPEAQATAPAAMAFHAVIVTATSWGFCFFWAGLAAIVIRRALPHMLPLRDVLVAALIAHAPAVMGYLFAVSCLRAAENEWARAGDAVTFEAIGTILDVGPIGDLLTTLAVLGVFCLLIRVRYRELPVGSLALSMLPAAVVLGSNFIVATLTSPLRF